MKNNKNYNTEKKKKETETEKETENAKENKRKRKKAHSYSRCIRWKKFMEKRINYKKIKKINKSINGNQNSDNRTLCSYTHDYKIKKQNCLNVQKQNKKID